MKRPDELEGLRGPMWKECLTSEPGCVTDVLVIVGKWLSLSEPLFPCFIIILKILFIYS